MILFVFSADAKKKFQLVSIFLSYLKAIICGKNEHSFKYPETQIITVDFFRPDELRDPILPPKADRPALIPVPFLYLGRKERLIPDPHLRENLLHADVYMI